MPNYFKASGDHEPMSVPSVHLGVSDTGYGYVLVDPSTQQIRLGSYRESAPIARHIAARRAATASIRRAGQLEYDRVTVGTPSFLPYPYLALGPLHNERRPANVTFVDADGSHTLAQLAGAFSASVPESFHPLTDGFSATPTGHVHLYVDGSYRPVSDSATYAFVLVDESGAVLDIHSVPAEIQKTEWAELCALIHGLRRAHLLGATTVTAFCDSKSVVDISFGNTQSWNDPLLERVSERGREFAALFESVDIVHVPRQQNRLADAAADLAHTRPFETRPCSSQSSLVTALDLFKSDTSKYGMQQALR